MGNGTDVGKTTIARAAIKVLNASGQRSVGFKPLAIAHLHDLVDLMLEKYPNASSKLFGGDAWQLTTASPWTGVDSIDLVVPIQMVCYPTWDSPILVRTGSRQLNNVEYFSGEYGYALKDRADFRRLIEMSGLPLANSVVLKKFDRKSAESLSPEKQKQAFECLLGIGVDSMVCEGASLWLPTWPDCPAINHLFYVANGAVTYFPNLNMEVPSQRRRGLKSVRGLSDVMKDPKRRRFSSPLFLAEKGRREDVAQEIVAGLISEAQQVR